MQAPDFVGHVEQPRKSPEFLVERMERLQGLFGFLHEMRVALEICEEQRVVYVNDACAG